MKTLCFSLGTLLLVACCCDAMPQAVQLRAAPVNCCYKFSDMRVPLNRISDIIKTHRSCLRQGFILKTVKRRLICFSQSTQWVQETYNHIRSNEGSGLQQ